MSSNRPNRDRIPTALPRVDCPVCGRDTAVYPSRLLYRHDPASGRTPELKSCPGSLKPVRGLEGKQGPGWPETLF